LNPKNKRNKEKALNFAYSDLLETGRKEFFAFVPKKKGLILTEIIVSNLCFQYGGDKGIRRKRSSSFRNSETRKFNCKV
jgi:hypothetical protein